MHKEKQKEWYKNQKGATRCFYCGKKLDPFSIGLRMIEIELSKGISKYPACTNITDCLKRIKFRQKGPAE